MKFLIHLSTERRERVSKYFFSSFFSQRGEKCFEAPIEERYIERKYKKKNIFLSLINFVPPYKKRSMTSKNMKRFEKDIKSFAGCATLIVSNGIEDRVIL